MLVENKVPSLLLLVFRQQLKQEKQLLKRLSHRLWKAISMRVGIGLGDTYGPMHYPGMRSLWQSPANFHQHLAFPSLPPSSCPPTWFLFLLLHLLLLSQKNKKPCVPVIVPGWGPLIEQQKEEKKNPYCSLSMPQSWRHVITLHCFPSWWNWLLILLGEKISLTQLW